MAMVALGAQQAIHAAASLRSSFSAGSSVSSDSTFRPSTSASWSSGSAARLVSRIPRELSRVGGIRQFGRRQRSLLGCRASALTPELKSALDNFVQSNKVVLFMKGTRQFPQCGFSNTCIQILNQCGVAYETVNILEDDSLRAGVKEYSQWPTYPQLYVDGEFYGGCDITLDAFKSGELQEALDKALVA